MQYKLLAKYKYIGKRKTADRLVSRVKRESAATVVVASASVVVATAAAENDDEKNDDPAAVTGTETVTH